MDVCQRRITWWPHGSTQAWNTVNSQSCGLVRLWNTTACHGPSSLTLAYPTPDSGLTYTYPTLCCRNNLSSSHAIVLSGQRLAICNHVSTDDRLMTVTAFIFNVTMAVFLPCDTMSIVWRSTFCCLSIRLSVSVRRCFATKRNDLLLIP